MQGVSNGRAKCRGKQWEGVSNGRAQEVSNGRG